MCCASTAGLLGPPGHLTNPIIGLIDCPAYLICLYNSMQIDQLNSIVKCMDCIDVYDLHISILCFAYGINCVLIYSYTINSLLYSFLQEM